MLNIWFRIMHCYIPIPTTDSNTSTGMISVILNMPSAANCQGMSHCLESSRPGISNSRPTCRYKVVAVDILL